MRIFRIVGYSFFLENLNFDTLEVNSLDFWNIRFIFSQIRAGKLSFCLEFTFFFLEFIISGFPLDFFSRCTKNRPVGGGHSHKICRYTYLCRLPLLLKQQGIYSKGFEHQPLPPTQANDSQCLLPPEVQREVTAPLSKVPEEPLKRNGNMASRLEAVRRRYAQICQEFTRSGH